jgi:hypothetical protein
MLYRQRHCRGVLVQDNKAAAASGVEVMQPVRQQLLLRDFGVLSFCGQLCWAAVQ